MRVFSRNFACVSSYYPPQHRNTILQPFVDQIHCDQFNNSFIGWAFLQSLVRCLLGWCNRVLTRLSRLKSGKLISLLLISYRRTRSNFLRMGCIEVFCIPIREFQSADTIGILSGDVSFKDCHRIRPVYYRPMAASETGVQSWYEVDGPTWETRHHNPWRGGAT